MISFFDNCLFVHIPKVAGQSVENVFLERAGLDWESRKEFLLEPNNDSSKGPPRLAHLTAEEYLTHGYLNQVTFDQLFKFSFVRNPWDRLVSEYCYRGYRQPFKTWLFECFPSESDDCFETYQDLYRHVMPQYKFLYREETLLMDYVGKFESLAHDFSEVTKKITGKTLSLPHKNKTEASKISLLKKVILQKNKAHYSDYYDRASIDRVAKLYAKDIDIFEYEFKLAK